MLRKFLDLIYRLTGYLAGMFLVSIFVLMLGMSLGRLVGINISSGDDYTAWCMAACAFLGLAHTFKSGDMIRVGLLLERLPRSKRHAVELFALVVGTVAIGYFAYFATVMTFDSWRFDDMSQGVVAIPLWIPQLGMSVGLVVLLVAFVEELVVVAMGRDPSYEKVPAESPEEFVERVAAGGSV